MYCYFTADDSITLRNGQERETQEYTEPSNNDENESTVEGRRDGNVRANRGLHESWEWYDNCYRRERNKGRQGFNLINNLNFLFSIELKRMAGSSHYQSKG